NKIVNENATFYVAKDNDNSDFFDDSIIHSRIINTYGYSIENSMYYQPISIEKAISIFCRKKLDFSPEFNTWISEFSQDVFDLIVYDIANNKFKKGIS